MAIWDGAGSLLISWVLNPLIWLVIIIVVLILTFGMLKIRKRRKLLYNCIEVVDYGKTDLGDDEDDIVLGKCGFNNIKCGWFGKKKLLNGLWDYGNEQLETKDGDIIEKFSTEHFQEIDGKRGIVVYRDPVNQNILVPIKKMGVFNKHLLAEIAPAEYRDTAVRIIEDADKETSDWKEKLMQFVAWGLVVIFSLISIIVITQMVKNGQTEASELILEAGRTCLENAKDVCSQFAQASNAP